jgi:hypothetical protein
MEGLYAATFGIMTMVCGQEATRRRENEECGWVWRLRQDETF